MDAGIGFVGTLELSEDTASVDFPAEFPSKDLFNELESCAGGASPGTLADIGVLIPSQSGCTTTAEF